jgi:23S rRNA A2030 N6-methylase RlmJ
MAYDHSDKIGNEGDVVKHAVLCGLVEAILDGAPNIPFV